MASVYPVARAHSPAAPALLPARFSPPPAHCALPQRHVHMTRRMLLDAAAATVYPVGSRPRRLDLATSRPLAAGALARRAGTPGSVLLAPTCTFRTPPASSPHDPPDVTGRRGRGRLPLLDRAPLAGSHATPRLPRQDGACRLDPCAAPLRPARILLRAALDGGSGNPPRAVADPTSSVSPAISSAIAPTHPPLPTTPASCAACPRPLPPSPWLAITMAGVGQPPNTAAPTIAWSTVFWRRAVSRCCTTGRTRWRFAGGALRRLASATTGPARRILTVRSGRWMRPARCCSWPTIRTPRRSEVATRGTSC